VKSKHAKRKTKANVDVKANANKTTLTTTTTQAVVGMTIPATMASTIKSMNALLIARGEAAVRRQLRRRVDFPNALTEGKFS
jgi:hypothetical protein